MPSVLNQNVILNQRKLAFSLFVGKKSIGVGFCQTNQSESFYESNIEFLNVREI